MDLAHRAAMKQYAVAWKRLRLAALLVALLPGFNTAHATYHTFKFAEIYSNPSGTVQFIELKESLGLNGQNLETLAPDILSGTNDFIFPNNLPSTATANKFFLLATAGFEALPGAPTPDYVIPSNFLKVSGGTLQYGTTGPDGVVDLTSFAAFPTDGTDGFTRVGTSGSNYSVAAAVAHTFGGATYTIPASIPEPSTIVEVMVAAVAIQCLRMLRRRRPDVLLKRR